MERDAAKTTIDVGNLFAIYSILLLNGEKLIMRQSGLTKCSVGVLHQSIFFCDLKFLSKAMASKAMPRAS
jgi:hypothetical protein